MNSTYLRSLTCVMDQLFAQNGSEKIQPSPRNSHSWSLNKTSILFLGFFIKCMYTSVVVSMLSVPVKIGKPETLEDLATKYTNLPIGIVEGTHVDEFVKSSVHYEQIKHRIHNYPYSSGDTKETEAFMENFFMGNEYIIEVTYVQLLVAFSKFTLYVCT